MQQITILFPKVSKIIFFNKKVVTKTLQKKILIKHHFENILIIDQNKKVTKM